jgi:hypothetical protein
MSRILSFYRGEGTDTEGRWLQDLWDWKDDDLEAVHDFIQWLFPLPEPSRFNPHAPLLSDEDIVAMRTDARVQANLLFSFQRILQFLGLTVKPESESVEVIVGLNFSARVPDVWAMPNHNWLRITRILRSLQLLGRERECRKLYDRLAVLYRTRRYPISEATFQYWTEAVEGRPFHG